MQRPEKTDIRIREAQNVAYEKLNGLIFLNMGRTHKQQETKRKRRWLWPDHWGPWMAATSVNFNQRCQGVIEGIAPGHGWNDMVGINWTYSVWRKAWGIHVQVNTVAWDLEWDRTGFELCNILASYLIPLRPQSPHQLPEGSNGAYISRGYMKMKWVNTYKKLKLFCSMESILLAAFRALFHSENGKQWTLFCR